MKVLDSVYIKIEDAIKIYAPNLLMEFHEKWEKESPKNTFLWLQNKSESGLLPKEVDAFLDDLFYALR
jgi:hypothetical protein